MCLGTVCPRQLGQIRDVGWRMTSISYLTCTDLNGLTSTLQLLSRRFAVASSQGYAWHGAECRGVWVVGWVLGTNSSNPALSREKRRAWGWVAACWKRSACGGGRFVLEEHSERCSWSEAASGTCASVLTSLPLHPALAPVLTHISHTLAIAVCSCWSCLPPATVHVCFLLFQRWLMWASVQKNVF